MTKGKPTTLAPMQAYQDRYVSPMIENPFEVSLDEKIGLLMNVNDILKKQKKIKIIESSLDFFRTDKIFCSTEGALIEQTIVESGGGYEATAIEKGDAQKRSYPNSHRGDLRAPDMNLSAN